MFILLLPGWRILTENFEKVNKIENKLAKILEENPRQNIEIQTRSITTYIVSDCLSLSIRKMNER